VIDLVNIPAPTEETTGTLAKVTATYEYSPFGQLIRATGTAVESNPFMFSTKYTDSETGFCYYGYRYYDALMGRWLNQDPISFTDDLYGFVSNFPVLNYDFLGLQISSSQPIMPTLPPGKAAACKAKCSTHPSSTRDQCYEECIRNFSGTATNAILPVVNATYPIKCGKLKISYQIDASTKANAPTGTKTKNNLLGVVLNASFLPKNGYKNDPNCCCNVFNWQQMVREDGGAWRPDSKPPAISPWYNPSNPAMSAMNFYDYPGQNWWNGSVKLDFKLDLLCEKGKVAGVSFAHIDWSVDIDVSNNIVKFDFQLY
jgi:RHS repeat-associated protein